MDDALIATFADEAEAVGTVVHRTTRSRLAEVIAGLLDGETVVLASALSDLASELRSLGVERVVVEEAGGAAADALPTAGVGVCVALAGVAASGSLLIGPGIGLEGVISTVPPHCVIVVNSDLIYPDLASALVAVAPLVATPGARLAFVTGPSRTSDIELTLVVGVHGPLRLDVVIADG